MRVRTPKPKKPGKAAPQGNPFPAHLFPALALCAIALLAYSNSFQGGFALDSNQLILHDPRIHEATSRNLGLIFDRTYWWPYGESGLYRPLTTLSYLFNFALLGNGESPFGYHAVNFLLHCGNVLLVYALALRLLGGRGRAFAAAALWSVHPVLTESVSYIVGRPELLAGIGVLGGLQLYLLSTETTGMRRWAALGGAALATAIGVFSKESAVTVAGVIAIYELAWWDRRRQIRGRIAGCAAVAAPIAAMLLVRARVLAASPQARFPFIDNPLVHAGFVEGRLTALALMARYLWRLLCPITLSADYSWAQIPVFQGALSDWISLLAVAAVTGAVVWAWRTNRTQFFLAGFAAVTFLPGSNLLFPIGTIMAERFLYLPAIAFCAFVVLWFRRAGPAVLCLLVTTYAARTWVRNVDWSDDLHMAQATVQTSPNSFKARKTLAFQLFHADERQTNETQANLDEVIDQAEKGLAVLDPLPNADNNAEAYRFAGNYYFIKGESVQQHDPAASLPAYQRASVLFRRAIDIMGWTGGLPDADAGFAYRQLALTYLRLSDPDRAGAAALKAVEADPSNPDRYLQMAQVLVVSKDVRGAESLLVQGIDRTKDQRLSNALERLAKQSAGSK